MKTIQDYISNAQARIEEMNAAVKKERAALDLMTEVIDDTVKWYAASRVWSKAIEEEKIATRNAAKSVKNLYRLFNAELPKIDWTWDREIIDAMDKINRLIDEINEFFNR